MESICGRCGLTFKVTKNNARPVDEDIPAEEPAPEGSADHCARCGRAFRGDWDRTTTNDGVICHICANQGQAPGSSETAFEAVAAPSDAAPDPQDLDLIDHDADAVADETATLGKRFEDFRETRAFRTGLWIAAISVIVLAVIATFIPSPTVPDDADVVTDTESGGGLGLFGPPEAWSESQQFSVKAVMFALEGFFMFAPTFAAIFIALALADRLPGYHWLTSAVHVGVVSLGLGFVIMIVSSVLGMLLGIIAVGIAYFIAIFFFWIIYDPNFSTIITFVGLRMVFGFLAGLLRLLAYGGLGLLLLD
jgi:hypothetical protein